MRLAGKVAIVTGGAQGIGKAIVGRFHEEGAAVAVFDIDQERGEAVVESFGESAPPAVFLSCDVTSEEQVRSAVAAAGSRFGRLDVLVNNAAIPGGGFAPEGMTSEEWDQFFAIDLKSAWLCAKYALPLLRHSGSAAIVNIGSIHSFMASKGNFPYATAKAGLLGLTRSLALEYADDGIRVNAVCPGLVETEFVRAWLEGTEEGADFERRVRERHPLRRFGRPEEIASLVAYLASDEAGFITAAAVLVDGGISALADV